MFEDSTFESTGRIRTRSRGWMAATFLFNGSVLIGLILVPLIYPEALPRQELSFLLSAPPLPPATQPLPKPVQQHFQGRPEMVCARVFAPPIIPTTIGHWDGPAEALSKDPISLDRGSGMPDASTVFTGRRPSVVAHPDVKGPVRVSLGVMAGSLIANFPPAYPAIAKAAGCRERSFWRPRSRRRGLSSIYTW